MEAGGQVGRQASNCTHHAAICRERRQARLPEAVHMLLVRRRGV